MAPGSNKTVYPSGSDLATYSEPMLLPAPGLFSMNTCWPHIAESLSARHARDNIRRTSRGDRHNDAHGFGWVAGLQRLRARRERPCGRAAEQRDELAPLHVWMAPAWQEKM